MTTVYLIRHCESEGNSLGRCHGAFDSPVTPRGRAQIAALRRRFADIHLDAVYSSDQYRAHQTALGLCEQVVALAGLREMHMGTWEDMAWGNIAREDAHGAQVFAKSIHLLDRRRFGGESLPGVARRGYATIVPCAQAHAGPTNGCGVHGTAMRGFLCRALGIELHDIGTLPWSDNTGVSRLQFDGQHFTLDYQCDNSHLTEGESTLAREKWTKEGAEWHELYLWFRPATAAECDTTSDWLTLPPQGSTLHCATALVGEQAVGFCAVATGGAKQPALLCQLRMHGAYESHEPFTRHLLGQACSAARKAGASTLEITLNSGQTALRALLQSGGFTPCDANQNHLQKPLMIDSLL